MITLGVFLAIVVAMIRGGRLERLGELGLRGVPFVWAALGLRIAAAIGGIRGVAHASWLQVAAYILFLYIVYLNMHYPGLKLFGLGSFLNFLTIAVNGGTMPVSAEVMARLNITTEPVGTHSVLTSATRLPYLADVIPFALPCMRAHVISVGDIFIMLGMFLFIQYRMLQGKSPGLVSVQK